MVEFAEWAVQAGQGKAAKADGATPDERSRLRRQGLAWLRKTTDEAPEPRALLLASHKIAPAIAAGCPTVIKPAPQTPLATLWLVHLIRQAAEKLEVPTAVVQLVIFIVYALGWSFWLGTLIYFVVVCRWIPERL